MATASALGKRRAEAIERVIKTCQALGGGESFTLPMFSHHGADMLLVLQLEAIATYLETVPAKSSYDAMTNKELFALIEQRELEQGKARNKAELIAILEAADETAESVGA